MEWGRCPESDSDSDVWRRCRSAATRSPQSLKRTSRARRRRNQPSGRLSAGRRGDRPCDGDDAAPAAANPRSYRLRTSSEACQNSCEGVCGRAES